MATYAGQRKVERDIEKRLKRGIANATSDAKRAKMNSTYYYAKLLNKNKQNKDNDTE